jgi:excinuclease UvrABC ATPase subunit
MDILSQHFVDENDPIAKDLRTMAHAVSKMADEEYQSRLASDVEAKRTMEMIQCPTCKGKVMKQTGYCLHCKKKIKDMTLAEIENLVKFGFDDLTDLQKDEVKDKLSSILWNIGNLWDKVNEVNPREYSGQYGSTGNHKSMTYQLRKIAGYSYP